MRKEAPMNIQLPAHMDKPSFLAWLQGREGRFELVGGRVLMMTGGTMAHGLIAGNVFQMLRARLDRKTWAVLTEFGVDVGPGSIRYPDVVVVDRRGTKAKDLTTTAPAFIVEVLSPSTSAIDLRDKATEYMRLSSVAAYLILSQDEIKAWVYTKGLADYLRPEVLDRAVARISVTALGIDLPLSEIYADVEFN
jgi:Uma2 family endonuclease